MTAAQDVDVEGEEDNENVDEDDDEEEGNEDDLEGDEPEEVKTPKKLFAWGDDLITNVRRRCLSSYLHSPLSLLSQFLFYHDLCCVLLSG